MVNLTAIRGHNATLKSVTSSLVAVFVGGTSGISLSTALALARHTQSPKLYLVGRSQSAADEVISSIKTINPSAQAIFLQYDISLLKNVDKVCDEIKAAEKKVNLLFMTPGYLTTKGRDETAEGLDRKFALHYYSRMRFVVNMLPLLSAAAKSSGDVGSSHGNQPDLASLSRVVSVLDPLVAVRPGGSGKLDFSDLSLKHSFTLKSCGAHASLMGNFFLESLAQRYPETSFIHAYPSGVATGVLRELPFARILTPVLKILLSAFMVPLEESGERHLFAATAARFPPSSHNTSAENNSTEDSEDYVAFGSNGKQGSGCYLLNWNGEAYPANTTIDAIRQQGAPSKVAEHTEEVFQRICDENGAFP